MEARRYHVTWFDDTKRTQLCGTTVHAKNITDAIKIVLKRKYLTKDEEPVVVDISMIKYAIEL